MFSLCRCRGFVRGITGVLCGGIRALSHYVGYLFVLCEGIMGTVGFRTRLGVLEESFSVLRVQAQVVRQNRAIPVSTVSVNLERLLRVSSSVTPVVCRRLRLTSHGALCALASDFTYDCRFFVLPSRSASETLLVNPCLDGPVAHTGVARHYEDVGVSLILTASLRECFTDIPVLPPSDRVFLALSTCYTAI